jgi:hypothetical protein
MKAKNFSAACLITVLLTSQVSQAASLIYGATLTPVPLGSGPTVGANVLFSGSSTFTAPDYSGTLTSTVFNNDASNPYGLSDLTFTYLIKMDSSTADPVSRFTISSFASYLTDASYATSVPGAIVPSSVNRSASPGTLVRFSFDSALLGASTTSALLVIQTDAQNWANTQAGLIDGVGSSANSVAPAPIPVPEPSATILSGLGLVGFLIVRRCRQGQPSVPTVK